LSGRLQSVVFAGPAGRLEGLWREPDGPPRGSAVFAHPHPLGGGTMHNKVAYRAAQELARAGWAALRFNFRGVGLSEGRHDAGRGEGDDFRAAVDLAVSTHGLPLVAGGFSFGSTVALREIAGDARASAAIAIGLPLGTESGRDVPFPSVPALFVTGERDGYGPPETLRRFVAGRAPVVVVPGADHFFEGRLDALGAAIADFLATLPVPARADASPSPRGVA
jgi:alpha/beta superfamily hydrolase